MDKHYGGRHDLPVPGGTERGPAQEEPKQTVTCNARGVSNAPGIFMHQMRES